MVPTSGAQRVAVTRIDRQIGAAEEVDHEHADRQRQHDQQGFLGQVDERDRADDRPDDAEADQPRQVAGLISHLPALPAQIDVRRQVRQRDQDHGVLDTEHQGDERDGQHRVAHPGDALDRGSCQRGQHHDEQLGGGQLGTPAAGSIMAGSLCARPRTPGDSTKMRRFCAERRWGDTLALGSSAARRTPPRQQEYGGSMSEWDEPAQDWDDSQAVRIYADAAFSLAHAASWTSSGSSSPEQRCATSAAAPA